MAGRTFFKNTLVNIKFVIVKTDSSKIKKEQPKKWKKGNGRKKKSHLFYRALQRRMEITEDRAPQHVLLLRQHTTLSAKSPGLEELTVLLLR